MYLSFRSIHYLVHTCPGTLVNPHTNFDSITINASRDNDQDIINPTEAKEYYEPSDRWQKDKLLSLGSNQKPSGCLDLAVITAERATNCATEDVETHTLLDDITHNCFVYNTQSCIQRVWRVL